MNKALGKRDIIAEDLGFLTPSVRKLLKDTGYPGMKVLEFAFDSRDSGSDYLPHCYTPHCVVYTGTHDNDTIQGWMATADRKDVNYAKEYLRLTKREGYHWGMMRSAWASAADLAVMQMQDSAGPGQRGQDERALHRGHQLEVESAARQLWAQAGQAAAPRDEGISAPAEETSSKVKQRRENSRRCFCFF